jgi:choline kinase
MNVVILAADGKDATNEETSPRCLSQYIGNVTLIERQLRVLSLYGVKRKDVCVVVGTQGVWENKQHVLDIRNLGCKVVENHTNITTWSSYSLLLGFEEITDSESSCLVISGDLNFDTKHLDTIVHGAGTNKCLVRQALSVGEKGTLVSCNRELLTDVGPKVRVSVFPWSVFCGMALVSEELIMLYKNAGHENKTISYISLLNKIKSDQEIVCIDYVNPKTVAHSYSSTTKDLTGGSFASLRKRHLIRKYSDEKGSDKLLDEINWLTSLPAELKEMFPVVVDHCVLPPEIWFDMPFYDAPNIRKNILNGNFNATEAIQITESLLDFVFNNLYTRVVAETPKNWVMNKHIARVENRLLQTAKEAPLFRSVLNAKSIVINGERYQNLAPLFFKLKNSTVLIDLFTPDKMRMIHGDLHFQNILLTGGNEHFPFTLADPRGELNGSDIYYDLGKLWHSFNGMYDLIHTDQYSLDSVEKIGDEVNVDLHLGTKQIVDVYNQIHNAIHLSVSKYELISEDKYWLLKIKFNEVMHFSSVVPFHLFDDGREHRALVLYFVAVRLINDFFLELEKSFVVDDIIDHEKAAADLNEFNKVLASD